MKIKSIVLAAALIMTLARSQAAIMYVEGGTPIDLAAYGQAAISFQVNTSITVTELSFYGFALGGGDTPYVQLWNDTTDTSLGLVSWTAGEAAAGWNSKVLSSSVTLNPGTTYQIQGSAWWVHTYANDSAFTYSPEFTSIQFLNTPGFGGWAPPGSPTTGAGAAASVVNLTYTAVPEPSTYALLGMGLAGLLILRHRKIKV